MEPRKQRRAFFERLIVFSNTLFLGLDNAYLRLLKKGVDLIAWLPSLCPAALLGLSLLLLPMIGSEFLPPSDEGEVRVTGKMEIGTRLALVDQQTRKMEKIVYPAVPEAVASVVTVGASGRRADAAGGRRNNPVAYAGCTAESVQR